MNGRFLNLDGVPEGARVLLAMSGGVDSAVSAVRLSEAGCNVIGLTMKNYCYGDIEVPERSCCSVEAIYDAKSVCDRVGIRHMVVSTQELFGREVYDNFLSEYRDARTPNPCVRCNSVVRFDTLAEYAGRFGMDYVATGHYARVFESDAGRRYLARPAHLPKDQSYFLSGLNHSSLDRVLFPLGEIDKQSVRESARATDLDVADKPESQEVCFMPDGKLRDFLDGKVPLGAGDIEMTSGEVVGQHHGISAYTVGQRRGLGVSAPNPLYVVRVDPARNVVVVGEDDALFERELTCRVGWMDSSVGAVSGAGDGRSESRANGGSEGGSEGLRAQIRSRQTAQPVASVEVDGATARVVFQEPQRAIAPGQTIAFYDGPVVVGAGVIESAGSSR